MDLRSIRYRVKQNIIWYHLWPYYEFQPLQVLCEEFSTLTNILKREVWKSTDLYPSLSKDDKRRNLTDRDIGEISLFGYLMFNPGRKGRDNRYVL